MVKAICTFRISLLCGAFATSAAMADTSIYDGLYRPFGSEFESWDCKSVGIDGGAMEIQGGQF